MYVGSWLLTTAAALPGLSRVCVIICRGVEFTIHEQSTSLVFRAGSFPLREAGVYSASSIFPILHCFSKSMGSNHEIHLQARLMPDEAYLNTGVAV